MYGYSLQGDARNIRRSGRWPGVIGGEAMIIGLIIIIAVLAIYMGLRLRRKM
jgi:hypothetical protein